MARTVTSVVALLVLAWFVAPALAHPGHDQTVMGTVKSIKGGQLEVEAKDGKVSTFTLAESTKVLRGKVKVAASEIKVGERVVAVGSTHQESGQPEGALMAKEIRLAAKQP
jgi:hypothetical protein